MTGRAAAGRYARALLDVAIQEGDPQKIAGELAEFQELLARHPDLARVLVNPAVPSIRKRAAMSEVVGLAQPSPVIGKLLLLLAERDRLALLPDLAGAYEARLMEHLQVVRAEVTTAAPLPDDRARAIARGLAEVTGRRVTVATSIDPGLIGGVVARIGSTVYDGSVVRQLDLLKEKLRTVER